MVRINYSRPLNLNRPFCSSGLLQNHWQSITAAHEKCIGERRTMYQYSLTLKKKTRTIRLQREVISKKSVFDNHRRDKSPSIV